MSEWNHSGSLKTVCGSLYVCVRSVRSPKITFPKNFSARMWCVIRYLVCMYVLSRSSFFCVHILCVGCKPFFVCVCGLKWIHEFWMNAGGLPPSACKLVCNSTAEHAYPHIYTGQAAPLAYLMWNMRLIWIKIHRLPLAEINQQKKRKKSENTRKSTYQTNTSKIQTLIYVKLQRQDYFWR